MNVEEVKRTDPAFFGKLLAYAVRTQNDSDVRFLVDKGNMDGIYNRYIKMGAEHRVNLPSSLYQSIEAAYLAKNQSEFDKGIKSAKTHVRLSVSCDVEKPFLMSPEYAQYRFDTARKEAEKNAAKAMKVLGISPKGKDLLLDAIAFGKIGKASDASKKLAALAKLEKLVEKEAVLLKNLKDSGLI